ncbi:MAG: HhH-GDP family DNA glycosylase [Candidatus Acidiferrales bacterium]
MSSPADNPDASWRMDFLVCVASVYQKRISDPTWAKYPDADSHPWGALGVFLEEYAFERQGRNPSFAHVASKVVEDFSQTPLNDDSAQQCWNQFYELLKSEPNKVNNPMLPSTEPGKGKATNGKKSAIEFALELAPKGLVEWAKSMLANNKTEEAHARVREIRGIGPKISSFFLRDIACKYRTFPTENRHLLQPVDTWVRRCVRLASGGNEPATEDRDREVAIWIVEHSKQPELANQGMWYFGAQVAGSEFRLSCALSSLHAANELMQEHVGSLRAGAGAWDAKGP